MYVIAELHAAVDMKPGSYVNLPVFAYSVRMSITSGPIVPDRIGKVTGEAPSEKLSVAVRSVIVRPSGRGGRVRRRDSFTQMGTAIRFSSGGHSQRAQPRDERGVGRFRLGPAGNDLPQRVVAHVEQCVE